MLSPNARSLYTSALTPPPDMVLDSALATTFSLDPATLLSVPVHLALLGNAREDPLRDGIAVLEAVRRLSSRITVYAQRGRLLVPEPPSLLYGLLEPMVVEVNAPRGGVFHPKIWLMRFVDPKGEAEPLLRLLILSRNLTADRSWDLALTLEGHPGGRNRAENRALGELIATLPALAVGEVPDDRRAQAEELAAELRRTEWELPDGFESVDFHVLGFKRRGWRPSESKRLAVISPFCRDKALEELARTSHTPDLLISRPEALAELSPETRASFSQCRYLREEVETDDGEVVDQDLARDTHGLHAKVYVFETRWRTHLVVGSANATNAALLSASNVEVLAELVGRTRRVGGIDALVGEEGLGGVTLPFEELPEEEAADSDEGEATRALEAARDQIAKADLGVRCVEATTDQGGEQWGVQLTGVIGDLAHLACARVWLITVGSEQAVELAGAPESDSIALGTYAPASLTGLVAFELRAEGKHAPLKFVLNLPVDGLPESRSAAMLQAVVRNEDGFLRYLLLLLGELGDEIPGNGSDGAVGGASWGSWASGGVPLLEEMVRAYSREPERLRDVAKVVERLTEHDNAPEVVPAKFLETWKVFEEAMERRDG